jgi:hypothetical protein
VALFSVPHLCEFYAPNLTDLGYSKGTQIGESMNKDEKKALRALIERGPLTDKRSDTAYNKAFLKIQHLLTSDRIVKLTMARAKAQADENDVSEWNRATAALLEALNVRLSDL